MKLGRVPKTGCVLLEELSQSDAAAFAKSTDNPNQPTVPEDAFLPDSNDEDIHNDMDVDDVDDLWSEGDCDVDIGEDGNDEENERYVCDNDKKKIGIAFRVVHDVPPDLTPATYSILNILEKSKEPPLIVWETSRRRTDDVFPVPKDNDPPLTKEEIIKQLQEHLSTIQDFTDNHPIWDQLDKISDSSLKDFYLRLAASVQTANQYVAAYNPAISYCTGAHNNVVLLGGDQQAKAATFYLCPYMGKLKFPLQDCLVILQQALEHVKKYPSVAKDTGTDKRTSTHVLQRCLNRLNLQMELSGRFEIPCCTLSFLVYNFSLPTSGKIQITKWLPFSFVCPV
jgi:hypothetical protein